MGYLGCGTTINKVAWTVFATLLALAAVLLGIGLAKTVPCTRALTACTRANPGSERAVCSLSFRHCARAHLIVAAAGVAAVLIAVCVVCCLCCCSKPPQAKSTGGSQPYGNMTGTVQMQPGYATAAPAASAGVMGQQQQQQQGFNPYGGAAGGGYSPYSQAGQPGWPQQGMLSGVPVTRY